jgi:hypothetical protein
VALIQSTHASASENDPKASVMSGDQVPDACPGQGSKASEANAVETKQPLVSRQPQRSIFCLRQIENGTKRNGPPRAILYGPGP